MKSSISDLITQKEVNSYFLDNDISQPGNRIKQKDENYKNLISNVKNVPYSTKSYNIIFEEKLELLSGDSKKINVKENAFLNINRFNNISESLVNNQVSVPEIESNNPTVNHDTVQENVVDDINQQFLEINKARQLVQNAKEEVKLAEAQVKKSDEDVNRLSIEQSEIEKKLEDAKSRKEEIKRKIMLAIGNQSQILSKAQKNYEDLAIEVNRRKEENQNKIIEFKSKIDENRQLLTREEAEIAEQQEILNAINDLTSNIDNEAVYQDPVLTNEPSIKVA